MRALWHCLSNNTAHAPPYPHARGEWLRWPHANGAATLLAAQRPAHGCAGAGASTHAAVCIRHPAALPASRLLHFCPAIGRIPSIVVLRGVLLLACASTRSCLHAPGSGFPIPVPEWPADSLLCLAHGSPQRDGVGTTNEQTQQPGISGCVYNAIRSMHAPLRRTHLMPIPVCCFRNDC